MKDTLVLQGSIMADVIPFPAEPDTAGDADDISDDSFLLREGLDLLADFRAIEDRSVRDSIRRLVRSMAQSTRAALASQ